MTDYHFGGFHIGNTRDYRGHETEEDYPVAWITVGVHRKRVDIRLTEEQLLDHVIKASETLRLLRVRRENRERRA